MKRRQFAQALGIGTVLAAAPAFVPVALAAETMEEVKKRGVLRAGVRQDVPGFGIVDEKGQTVGFDIDIAAELAAVNAVMAGCRPEYFPVVVAALTVSV